jgi:hypothetical protein
MFARYCENQTEHVNTLCGKQQSLVTFQQVIHTVTVFSRLKWTAESVSPGWADDESEYILPAVSIKLTFYYVNSVTLAIIQNIEIN